MLKIMHDKKIYWAYVHKQFVLPKSLRREQRMFILFEDHHSEIYR